MRSIALETWTCGGQEQSQQASWLAHLTKERVIHIPDGLQGQVCNPCLIGHHVQKLLKKMDQEISTVLGKEQSDDLHLGPNSLHSEYSCSDTLGSAESHSAAAHNGDMDPKETSATTNKADRRRRSRVSRLRTIVVSSALEKGWPVLPCLQ